MCLNCLGTGGGGSQWPRTLCGTLGHQPGPAQTVPEPEQPSPACGPPRLSAAGHTAAAPRHLGPRQPDPGSPSSMSGAAERSGTCQRAAVQSHLRRDHLCLSFPPAERSDKIYSRGLLCVEGETQAGPCTEAFLSTVPPDHRGPWWAPPPSCCRGETEARGVKPLPGSREQGSYSLHTMCALYQVPQLWGLSFLIHRCGGAGPQPAVCPE